MWRRRRTRTPLLFKLAGSKGQRLRFERSNGHTNSKFTARVNSGQTEREEGTIEWAVGKLIG